jgi:hypothetical protein
MHNISNLNKFQDSYQVLEKNPKHCFLKKKRSRIHKECLKIFFGPRFLAQTPLVLVHKSYEHDKNQVLYCNVKS